MYVCMYAFRHLYHHRRYIYIVVVVVAVVFVMLETLSLANNAIGINK